MLVRLGRAGELFHRQAAGAGARGIGGQQRVDVGLAGIAGFFQGGSPLIGQGLFLWRVDLVFVSHDFLDRHSIRWSDRHAFSGARSGR